jgi:hypothetical protein
MNLTSAERSARYRAKDVKAYRKRKRELARTPKRRRKRTAYMRLYRAAHRQPRKPRPRIFTDEQIKERRRARALEYRKLHREKLRRQSARYYKTHGKKKSYRAKVRDYHLRKKYGITSAQWAEIFIAQGSKCKICSHSAPRNKRGWHLDHCHKSGKVRGILCHVCNTKLGWFEQFRKQIQEYLV